MSNISIPSGYKLIRDNNKTTVRCEICGKNVNRAKARLEAHRSVYTYIIYVNKLEYY